MKKVTAIILLIISVTLLFSSGVASASEETFVFELSSSSVLSFRECPVILSFKTNPGISAGALNITYDYTKVALLRYEIAEGFSADVISVIDNKYGQIRFVFLSGSGTVRDIGQVLKLYFVSTALTSCSSDITVTTGANALYDEEYNPAVYSCVSGSAVFISSEFWLKEESAYLLDFDGRKITGVLPGTSTEAFTANFSGSFELIAANPLVGTGTSVNANDESYYIVVRGDVNGDGTVGVMDYISIRLSLLGISPLEGIRLEAADADLNGALSVTDYILIRLYILGISDLYRQN
ncbi:MAG: dockerin type I repeat-containing protein [Eubacteriales bacterium]|nr:dockerin type I repeat-containing protein [Eubacteriales bacterium]